MVDLRQLRQFVAVAEEQHYNRAAERLGMSQPPLTIAIKKIEDEIGAVLIERGRNFVGLTPAGAIFYDEAKHLLAQAEQMLRKTKEVASGEAGHLILTYVGSTLYGRLPDHIRQFRSRYPKVKLEVREATSQAQLDMLARKETDIAILHDPLSLISGITAKPYDNDRLCMALPRSHRLADEEHLDIGDLNDEDFIFWPAAQGNIFYAKAIKLCTAAGFMPNIVQEVHQMHGVLSLVAVEAGVAIVPQSMSSFRSEEITYRPIASTQSTFTLSALFHEQSKNRLVHNFMQSKQSPHQIRSQFS